MTEVRKKCGVIVAAFWEVWHTEDVSITNKNFRRNAVRKTNLFVVAAMTALAASSMCVSATEDNGKKTSI